MAKINQIFNLKSKVYDAIEHCLEELNYNKTYPVAEGIEIKAFDSEEPNDKWFQRAVEVHYGNGGVEVFTLCWDRKKQGYRILTEAELFRGDVDLIDEASEEIAEWLKENA